MSPSPQIIRYTPEDLGLDVDWVLMGQGADPQKLRARRPQLVDIAARALQDGLPLLKPQAAIQFLEVRSFTHNRLELENGFALHGQAIAQHLSAAQKVALMVYTVGEELEARIAEEMAREPSYGLALDGLGTGAIDAMGGRLFHHYEDLAARQNMQLSIFVSPGMKDWTVEEGQPQIFAALDTREIGVRVTPGWQMLPRKTASAVIGFGKNLVPAEGLPCEYCSLNETCRYKGRHAHAAG